MFLTIPKRFGVHVAIAIIFAVAILPCFAPNAHAATLFVSPESSNVTVGNIVSVSTMINSAGVAINNSDGILQYPTDLLSVVSVDTRSSIFSLWVEQPKFSNNDGTVTWNGGVPTPGYTGPSGQIVTITFMAKKAGTASLIYSDSAVRANDGNGTDVLTGKTGATITITPSAQAPVIPGLPRAPIITSETHKDPNKWYSNSNPVFDWVVPSGVTSVHVQYAQSEINSPAVAYTPPINTRSLTNIPDGTYYFNAQFGNVNGLGPTTHFKFNIDTIPPNNFDITATNSDENKLLLSFVTTDSGSGMDHYDVKIGDGNVQTVSAEIVAAGPYAPATNIIGNTTATVNAYDKAGNVTKSTANITIRAIHPAVAGNCPTVVAENYTTLDYWLFLLVIILIIIIIIIVFYYNHKLAKLKRMVRRTAAQTEEIVHNRIHQLEKDMVDYLGMLKGAKDERERAEVEKAIFSNFRQYLLTTEKEVDAETALLKKEAE